MYYQGLTTWKKMANHVSRVHAIINFIPATHTMDVQEHYLSVVTDRDICNLLTSVAFSRKPCNFSVGILKDSALVLKQCYHAYFSNSEIITICTLTKI